MSRTYKDRPHRVQHEDWNKDRIQVFPGTWHYIYLPTTKTKKRKALDTEEHWMTTPGWWIRLRMNKPQRRGGSLWERKAVLTDFSSLLELDTPDVSRKPHIYFW